MREAIISTGFKPGDSFVATSYGGETGYSVRDASGKPVLSLIPGSQSELDRQGARRITAESFDQMAPEQEQMLLGLVTSPEAAYDGFTPTPGIDVGSDIGHGGEVPSLSDAFSVSASDMLNP